MNLYLITKTSDYRRSSSGNSSQLLTLQPALGGQEIKAWAFACPSFQTGQYIDADLVDGKNGPKIKTFNLSSPPQAQPEAARLAPGQPAQAAGEAGELVSLFKQIYQSLPELESTARAEVAKSLAATVYIQKGKR